MKILSKKIKNLGNCFALLVEYHKNGEAQSAWLPFHGNHPTDEALEAAMRGDFRIMGFSPVECDLWYDTFN